MRISRAADGERERILSSTAAKIAPISVDAKRRRLDARVGRRDG